MEKARLLEPEFDKFVRDTPSSLCNVMPWANDQGILIPETLNRADPFEARGAIAAALSALAPLVKQDMIIPIFDFLIDREALGDRNGSVRRNMLNAAIALVDSHGGEAVTSLMKMFEDYLARSKSSKDDYVQEAVIIVRMMS